MRLYYQLLTIGQLEVLFYISFSFLLVRLLVACYNWVSKPVLATRAPKPNADAPMPLLSILVPARNEGHNLPILLSSILSAPYSCFELLILDDSSSDNTSEVIATFANKDRRIQGIKGRSLPEDWLGKNWACHQLAQLAKGEYLLFLDADTEVHNNVLQTAVAHSMHHRLALLSLFPEQCMKSLGEKCTVPIMHYLLLSMLPLDFVYRFRQPSLAAANGQFMLFDKRDYDNHLFHELLKQEIVEDIKIMQQVKRVGLKGQTLLGTDLITCRMYHSLTEGVKGFQKNLLAGFGNSKLGLWTYLTVILLIPLVTLIWNPWVACSYYLVALLVRVLLSLLSRQKVGWNLLLHPFHMGLLFWLGIHSLRQTTGNIEWKGRRIN